MFGRHERMSPIEEIDFINDTHSPVITANDLLNEGHRQLLERGTHPWHASDQDLLKSALYATAIANFLTGQVLRDSGAVTHGDRTSLPADIADFALGSMRNGQARLDEAYKVLPSQDTVEFDEELRTALNAENMVPYWPRSSGGGGTEVWQGKDEPVVSQAFLKCIIAAARRVGEYAAQSSDWLSTSLGTAVPVPAEYTAMPDVIHDLIKSAEDQLATAEATLASPANNLPDPIMRQAYQQVHDGYIGMMTALVGNVCPPVLGEDFLPER